jgi:uncharacterized membrane protein HdeD (DUF308 family)
MTDPQTNRPDSGPAGAAGGMAAGAGGTAAGAGGTAAGGGGVAAGAPPNVPAQGRSAFSMGATDQGGDPGRDGRSGRPDLGAVLAGAAWGAVLAAAIGMLAVGVMLLVWPSATLTVVALLIGAALLVAGVLRLFDAIAARGESGAMRAADVVIGVLAIIAGLYCLKHHSLTVLVLALVVGVLWIIHGIGDLIVAATAGPVPGRGLKAIGGVVSLAAGLVILFWPSVSLVLLLTILGAWLLFYGLVLAMLAFRLRQVSKGSGSPNRSSDRVATA